MRTYEGKCVVVDFWTFCCINCLHVLDEPRELEEKHRDTVVIIGVHSPKFVHEAEHQAVVDAVERYGVEHPVLDDPANAYPACHVHQQDWGVPVRLTEGAADRLPLVLAGMDDLNEQHSQNA